MRKILTIMASLSLFGTLLGPVSAQTVPKFVQRSMILNLDDLDYHWSGPNLDKVVEKSTWIPKQDALHFVVEGPMSEGGKFSMEFLKPDGKTWIQTVCFGPDSLSEGQVADVNCNTIDAKKGIFETGNISFKVHYENESDGVKTDLFKGHVKVGSYTTKDTKKPHYYLSEDWRVPLAYVALDSASEPGSPEMKAYFWFKNRDVDFNKLVGELVYNGKVVALNTDGTNFANLINDRRTSSEPQDHKLDFSYQLWKFSFNHVRGKVDDPDSSDSEWHVLAQNPGNYEIRVKYAGELVRTASFTVGSDGQILAPGSVEKDSDGNLRILIPTKVSGKIDYAWDKNAYKTEMYYGNPGAMTSGILAP